MSLGPKHQVWNLEPGARLKRASDDLRTGEVYYYVTAGGRTLSERRGSPVKAWQSALARLQEMEGGTA